MGKSVETNFVDHPFTAKVINKSGLRPLGGTVLVQPYEPEIEKGLIAIPETVKDRTVMVETRAIVIEVGSECWKDEARPRAMPGDKVLISKFAGAMAVGTKDRKTYRVVNARDIYCGLED